MLRKQVEGMGRSMDRWVKPPEEESRNGDRGWWYYLTGKGSKGKIFDETFFNTTIEPCIPSEGGGSSGTGGSCPKLRLLGALDANDWAVARTLGRTVVRGLDKHLIPVGDRIIDNIRGEVALNSTALFGTLVSCVPTGGGSVGTKRGIPSSSASLSPTLS